MVSGLRINLLKSNLYEVGVGDADVTNVASIMGCGPSSFLFMYLGIHAGESMVRIKG